MGMRVDVVLLEKKLGLKAVFDHLADGGPIHVDIYVRHRGLAKTPVTPDPSD
jgi:hypothetical protein